MASGSWWRRTARGGALERDPAGVVDEPLEPRDALERLADVALDVMA
jgi:hypothetical protein